MSTKNRQKGTSQGGLTRRQFLKGSLATAGVAAGLSAGLGDLYRPYEAEAAQNQVTFCSWGGALSDAQRKFLFKPFTDQTGIAVNEATVPLIAKIKAMVDTGNIEWDVVAQDMLTIISLQKAGNYLEKIDYSMIDKEILEGVPKELQTTYGIGYMYWSYNIAYRTDAFGGKHPQNWAEIWDVKKFPGKRTLTSAKGGQYPNLEFALLADGVPVNKLYPLDVDRAFKSMDRIKPHILQWWDSGKQPGDLLINKEITCGSAYSGRIMALTEAGKPVNVDWNQGQLSVDYLAVVKGTKNFTEAMKFVNFALKTRIQADVFNAYMAGPANLKAFSYISKDRALLLPSSPVNRPKMFMQDAKWWADNQDTIFERFMAWTLK
jgi:putative spermidine/putrescine transport system substrate-binding protein